MDRSPLLLAAVLAVHLADSWLFARAWLRRGDDRFWGIVLLTFAQWGTLATVLSLGHALTPVGWLLGLVAITAAAIAVARLPRPAPQASAPEPGPRPRLRPPMVVGLGLLAVIVAGAFVVQWRTPLHKGDDLMYHGSRAAYWLEHRSLLPYPTHNDRQNVFPTAGDLPFLLGLLFTRDERVARLLHLVALPLAAWGLLRLERVLGVRGPAALAGPLLFVTTPLVLASAEGIGAELWTTVGVLGLLHSLVGALRGASGRGRLGWFGLGAFAALGLSFKMTLLPVLALLPAALFVRRMAPPPLTRRAAGLAGGLVAGAIASGLALTLTANVVTYGHPLGPPGMRRVHTSDAGARSLRVHAARVPFLLTGAPALWSEGSREALERAANGLADRMGATETLRGEERARWPGSFVVRIPRLDRRFALTAVFGVGAAAFVLCRCWRRRRRGLALLGWPPVWIVLGMGAAFLGIVFGLRWQAAAGLPDRFLVPLLAPAAALASIVFSVMRRRRGVAVALILLLAWGLIPGTILLAGQLKRVVGEPPRAPGRVGLFAEAEAALPDGARVLLVSDQNATDYVLFAPESGFSNVVIPWGQRPFDPASFADRLARDRPTHVLIENADRVDFHWGGTMGTREMVSAVAALPGARRIPLPDGAMRLFALE